jgi:hypothetical protein
MRERRPYRIPLDLRGLSGRVDIFRISGAVEQDPAIECWWADGSIELRSIAQQWFLRMRKCGADVREVMHDGCPVACVEDAPFGYVNSFKSHINVGFFYGAALEDPAGLLEGSGKRMRHTRLAPDSQVNGAALNDLIEAAYLDIRIRLDAGRHIPT